MPPVPRTARPSASVSAREGLGGVAEGLRAAVAGGAADLVHILLVRWADPREDHGIGWQRICLGSTVQFFCDARSSYILRALVCPAVGSVHEGLCRRGTNEEKSKRAS